MATMPHVAAYQERIRDAMSDLAAVADSAVPVEQRLAAVTNATVALLRGATSADILLVNGDRHHTIGSTSGDTAELNTVQMRHSQGPCLEAAFDHPVVRVMDLSDEPQWPEFATAALRHGVRSVMTFRLYRSHHRAGALNIYGFAAGAFNVDDEALGAVLAAHAAILLRR
jgi:GAF domain-containing protein